MEDNLLLHKLRIYKWNVKKAKKSLHNEDDLFCIDYCIDGVCRDIDGKCGTNFSHKNDQTLSHLVSNNGNIIRGRNLCQYLLCFSICSRWRQMATVLDYYCQSLLLLLDRNPIVNNNNNINSNNNDGLCKRIEKYYLKAIECNPNYAIIAYSKLGEMFDTRENNVTRAAKYYKQVLVLLMDRNDKNNSNGINIDIERAKEVIIEWQANKICKILNLTFDKNNTKNKKRKNINKTNNKTNNKNKNNNNNINTESYDISMLSNVCNSGKSQNCSCNRNRWYDVQDDEDENAFGEAYKVIFDWKYDCEKYASDWYEIVCKILTNRQKNDLCNKNEMYQTAITMIAFVNYIDKRIKNKSHRKIDQLTKKTSNLQSKISKLERSNWLMNGSLDKQTKELKHLRQAKKDLKKLQNEYNVICKIIDCAKLIKDKHITISDNSNNNNNNENSNSKEKHDKPDISDDSEYCSDIDSNSDELSSSSSDLTDFDVESLCPLENRLTRRSQSLRKLKRLNDKVWRKHIKCEAKTRHINSKSRHRNTNKNKNKNKNKNNDGSLISIENVTFTDLPPKDLYDNTARIAIEEYYINKAKIYDKNENYYHLPCLKKCKLNESNCPIAALKNQFGLKTTSKISKHRIIGEYIGTEMLPREFENECKNNDSMYYQRSRFLCSVNFHNDDNVINNEKNKHVHKNNNDDENENANENVNSDSSNDSNNHYNSHVSDSDSNDRNSNSDNDDCDSDSDTSITGNCGSLTSVCSSGRASKKRGNPIKLVTGQPRKKRRRLNVKKGSMSGPDRKNGDSNSNIDKSESLQEKVNKLKDEYKTLVIEPNIDKNGNRCILSYINDCRDNLSNSIATEKDLSRRNVEFVAAIVNGWPKMFVMSVKTIKKDSHLWLYYGSSYSKAHNDHRQYKNLLQIAKIATNVR